MGMIFHREGATTEKIFFHGPTRCTPVINGIQYQWDVLALEGLIQLVPASLGTEFMDSLFPDVVFWVLRSRVETPLLWRSLSWLHISWSRYFCCFQSYPAHSDRYPHLSWYTTKSWSKGGGSRDPPGQLFPHQRQWDLESPPFLPACLPFIAEFHLVLRHWER